MSFNDNPIDSDWNTIPLKEEKDIIIEKKAIIRPKENRNFCERWLSLFSPWLSRCENDSNRPFCRACQRPLDNNRFRLQRHERTAKHSRNQEILLNEGEDAVRLLLSRCRPRRRYIKKDTNTNNFALNIEHTSFEDEKPFKKLKLSKAIGTPIERNRSDSFMYTKGECQNISEYYYSPHSYSRPQTQPKKDSFDMFFEAISATVKSLPPKLAAEVKSRISQVIAEFELRAICENEAKEKAQQSITELPTQTTNVVTIDPVINTETHEHNTNVNGQTSENGSAVTQYVYSYQQKGESN